ncbi:MAG TPA: hypothetical protein ENJ01_10410 [Gammaproteobacteria bacterium]|nr:hypothetical protein [Gammaproteobacteria bacterium]
MSNVVFQLYLSYAQLCVFSSTLSKPFNDWSDRNFSQGFSWRPGSACFRSLDDEGYHCINVFVNEAVSPLSERCIRAFQVPFETMDGKIEIASISDSTPIEILPGKYILQVEFQDVLNEEIPVINVRLNQGEAEFTILRADHEIDANSELDLEAKPAE